MADETATEEWPVEDEDLPPGVGPVPALAMDEPEPAVGGPSSPMLSLVPAPAPPTLPFVSPPPGVDPATDRAALNQEAIANAKAAAAAGVERARIEAQNAEELAQKRQALEERKQAAVEKGLAQEREAMGAWKQAVERHGSAKLEDFWTDRPTGDKIMAGIALAFGTIGAGLSGFAGTSTGNLGAAALQRRISEDFQQQRTRIEHLGDQVAMTRTGLLDARSAKLALLRDTDAKEAAALQAVEARSVARLKAQGVTSAEIAGDATVIALRQRQLALEEEYRRERQKEILAQTKLDAQAAAQAARVARRPGAGRAGIKGQKPGKAPTESQARLAAYADEMGQALNRLDRLGGLGADALNKLQRNTLASQAADISAGKGVIGNLTVRAGRAFGAVPKSRYEGLSPREQRSANAWDVAKEAYMRIVSGGAIANEEERRLALNAMPSAGDSEELIRDKIANMRRRARTILALSGSAGELLPPTAAGETAAAKVQTGRTKDGQTVYRWPDGKWHTTAPR